MVIITWSYLQLRHLTMITYDCLMDLSSTLYVYYCCAGWKTLFFINPSRSVGFLLSALIGVPSWAMLFSDCDWLVLCWNYSYTNFLDITRMLWTVLRFSVVMMLFCDDWVFVLYFSIIFVMCCMCRRTLTLSIFPMLSGYRLCIFFMLTELASWPFKGRNGESVLGWCG